VPGGTQVYDECHVCGGNNVNCIDCAGVPLGKKVFDACGKCVDVTSKHYEPTCYDCLGVANGTAVRDLCGNCPANWHHCHYKWSILNVIIERFSSWLWIVATLVASVAVLLLCCMGFFLRRRRRT
jgi:hypothetical protein